MPGCKSGRPKPIVVEGVEYPSRVAAAKAYGLLPMTLWWRLQNGKPLDTPVQNGGWRNVHKYQGKKCTATF